MAAEATIPGGTHFCEGHVRGSRMASNGGTGTATGVEPPGTDEWQSRFSAGVVVTGVGLLVVGLPALLGVLTGWLAVALVVVSLVLTQHAVAVPDAEETVRDLALAAVYGLAAFGLLALPVDESTVTLLLAGVLGAFAGHRIVAGLRKTGPDRRSLLATAAIQFALAALLTVHWPGGEQVRWSLFGVGLAVGGTSMAFAAVRDRSGRWRTVS